MLRARLSRLSTRFYAIVAIALLLTAGLSQVLLSLATGNAYAMRELHLSDVTGTAMSILTDLEHQVDGGILTREDAQSEAKRILNTLSFGNAGYFYTFDHDLNIVVLPVKPEWVGTNKSDFEDVNGLKIYQELRDVSLENGAGAVTYHFIRPGSETPEAKIGYAANFAPWNWIVGTGSYVSDIEAELAYLQRISIASLLATLAIMAVASTAVVRSVTAPITALVERMIGMREGDHDSDVPHTGSTGEIGQMAQSIDVFRVGLVERTRLETERTETDAELGRQREAALRQRLESEATHAREAEQRRDEEIRRQAERDAQRAQAEAERERNRQEQSLIVNALSESLSAMSGGDLSVRIAQTFPAGYETLRMDFNDAVSQIEDLVSSMVDGSSAIQCESQSLNCAAIEMSRRTESQAASLEETAAAITELSASVSNSTAGAHDAAARVRKAREKSVAGKDVVQQTISAMAEISESSGKIARITSVIDGIAFQTNLLALNAGVEAARAGEAGRGFTVVASEVRALAQRSSDAAREIAELIDTSGQQVESGVSLVNDSGRSLDEIEALVASLDDLVSGIAESSAQQSIGLSEISTAVNRLDHVTQQNAAMFEETTAAVNALQSQAENLDQSSASFKLSSVAKGAPFAA